jgi:hypothetical protein
VGIPVEEFRRLADESRYGNVHAPPTPRAYVDTDEV